MLLLHLPGLVCPVLCLKTRLYFCQIGHNNPRAVYSNLIPPGKGQGGRKTAGILPGKSKFQRSWSS